MERKEIRRETWKIIVWTPIIIGAIIWSIMNTIIIDRLIGNVLERGLIMGFITLGSVLIGWGFGLAYARYFKIKEIDY